ncbi:AAA family ATPase [Clavibacter michiganensis]|nr:ATP-binding protein [Clavibacter michiganensis]
MTIISRFVIRGLAGRRLPVSHQLHPYVNVLWGLNGSGKTTLLKILHSALKNDAMGLEALPFDSAQIEFRDNEGRVSIRTFSQVKADPALNEMRYRVVEDGEGNEYYESILEGPERPGEWETSPSPLPDRLFGANGGYPHTFLSVNRILETRSTERPFGTTKAQLDRPFDSRFAKHIEDAWMRYSNRSNRNGREIQQQGLASVLSILFGDALSTNQALSVKELTALPDARAAYVLVQDFLRSQGYSVKLDRRVFTRKYDTSIEHRLVTAEIQAIQARLDALNAPQLELESLVSGLYVGAKTIHFNPGRYDRERAISVEVEGQKVPLASLSAGEKQLLYILLETMAASGVVMVDEPEISLHPDWQMRLIRSMQRVNSNAQIILASHSPEIVSRVPRESVIEI